MTMVASRTFMPRYAGDAGALLEANRRFYDPLWQHARVVAPERFNTWPLVSSLLASSRARLEVAPGLNPRLPLAGTQFVDVSAAAVSKLLARGANATVGLVGRLPYADASYDLVAAFDIIEHTDDDAALAELSRVAAPGATLLLSAPIHASQWSSFDELVGHGRRYEIDDLVSKLAVHGWSVERSAIYGMQPSNPWLLDLAVWAFHNRRSRAIWLYTHVLLPLAAFFQPRLRLAPGLIDVKGVDEVLLVCRRSVPLLGAPQPSHAVARA
jgi:SAM-dependent methyltransferase